MSASVKFNQQSLFTKAYRLLRTLGEISKDDYLKRDLAQFTKDMLYKRVKSGKGVNSDRSAFEVTSHQRLRPLSKNYKRYRRTGIVEFEAFRHHYNSAKGRHLGGEKVKVSINVGKPALGEFGTPEKSNLTFTGQLLASISINIKKFGFTIYIPETKRRGENITNAQLARYVSQNGRPFMNLTAGEIRIVKSRMKKTIQKSLKRLLK